MIVELTIRTQNKEFKTCRSSQGAAQWQSAAVAGHRRVAALRQPMVVYAAAACGSVPLGHRS